MSYGVNAPQGFVPVTTTTGATFNAAAVQYFNIDPAAASNAIFIQDAVITSHTNPTNTTGSWIARLATSAGIAAAPVVGTFVTCQYVVPQSGAPNGTIIQGYWPGNAGATVAGTSVVATVLMDPTIVYDVQSTTVGGVTGAQQFFNAQIVQPALGNTSSGISGQSIIAQAAANNTWPVKILGLSNGGGGSNTWGINNNNVYALFNTPAFATNTAGL